MNRIVLLAVGGLLGTLARYGLNGLVSNHQARTWTTWATFPLGTMVVNVTGCFVIGAIAAVSSPDAGRFWIKPEWRDFLMVGVCGGYTTFSSYGLQSLNLAKDGEWGSLALNVVGSNALGLLAVWLGWMFGMWAQARLQGGAA
jgi:CrcB protein